MAQAQRFRFGDGSVLKVQWGGDQEPVLQCIVRRRKAVRQVIPDPAGASIAWRSLPADRSLSAGDACDEDDSWYDELVLDQPEVDGPQQPSGEQPARAAMILPFMKDVFRTMNSSGCEHSDRQKLEAMTCVLTALDALMDELGKFLGVGGHAADQPLLHAIRALFLQHTQNLLSPGDAGSSHSGDGDSGDCGGRKRARDE